MKSKNKEVGSYKKICEPIYKMVENRNLDELQNYINSNDNLVNPALMVACELGDITFIKELINHPKVDLLFTTPFFHTSFLKEVCSVAEEYNSNSLYEAVDLLLNKAEEKGLLKELLTIKNNLDCTALFDAILTSDTEAALTLVEKLLIASTKCQINLFSYESSTLYAALRRDHDVEKVLSTILKYDAYTSLSQEEKAKLVQEALESCANDNNVKQAILVTSIVQDIFNKNSYELNKSMIKSIVKPVEEIALKWHFNNFVCNYEEYLISVLGEDPFISRDSDY